MMPATLILELTFGTGLLNHTFELGLADSVSPLGNTAAEQGFDIDQHQSSLSTIPGPMRQITNPDVDARSEDLVFESAAVLETPALASSSNQTNPV